MATLMLVALLIENVGDNNQQIWCRQQYRMRLYKRTIQVNVVFFY